MAVRWARKATEGNLKKTGLRLSKGNNGDQSWWFKLWNIGRKNQGFESRLRYLPVLSLLTVCFLFFFLRCLLELQKKKKKTWLPRHLDCQIFVIDVLGSLLDDHCQIWLNMYSTFFSVGLWSVQKSLVTTKSAERIVPLCGEHCLWWASILEGLEFCWSSQHQQFVINSRGSRSAWRVCNVW